MIRMLFALVFVAAACGDDPPAVDARPPVDAALPVPDGGPNPDAGPAVDAAIPDAAAPDAAAPDAAIPDAAIPDAAPPDAAPPDAALPYRRTVVIDGVNDFVADETFTTTSSPTFTAYVTWDDTNLYIGYEGPDIDVGAPDSGNKWVQVYFDVDPGLATGAAIGEQYNTQRPDFPMGFGADLYYRWKSDDTFEDIQMYNAGTDTWSAIATTADAQVIGTFVEVAIPLADLGAPSTLGVTSFMVNETPLQEGSFAGLYTGNFADGYYPLIPLTLYLEADFSSPLVPNDPANQAP